MADERTSQILVTELRNWADAEEHLAGAAIGTYWDENMGVPRRRTAALLREAADVIESLDVEEPKEDAIL